VEEFIATDPYFDEDTFVGIPFDGDDAAWDAITHPGKDILQRMIDNLD
jgi:hypothetical protein